MKPCIACLLLVSVICLQSACILAIDWESLDNPGGERNPVSGDAPDNAHANAHATATAPAPAEQALIDEGKRIYQKYVDGKYLDAEGVPDIAKAPAALQRETSAWAERVEKAGFDVDKIMEQIENAFI